MPFDMIPEEDHREIENMLREIYEDEDNYRDIYGSWPTQG